MSSQSIMRAFIGIYILAFFMYLFGPLILMSLTAFNSFGFPRVSPWECFTTEWFVKLSEDKKLMGGMLNSLIIGVGVVSLSVPIGLAGAIMLTQVRRAFRPIYYTIVISPILVPGVVLGISTLIFWDRMGTMFDAGYKSVFYDGMFLTIIGQSTFVSAYCMLVFIARLQRFDQAQEEAALDLGATHAQTFRKILLPFMRPAIASAAVLAFLASFENYNTTVFTIISESTLTTVLASKVRYGIDPSVSALAVIIVAVTLIGATAFEFAKQRELKLQRIRTMEGMGTPAPQTRASLAEMIGNPAMILMILITVAGLAFVYLVTTVDTGACKAELKEFRELEQKRRQDLQLFPIKPPSATAPSAPAAPAGQAPSGQAPGTTPYQGIFDPGNLGKTGPDSGNQEEKPKPAPGTENYKSIFDPGNLKGQAEGGEKKE